MRSVALLPSIAILVGIHIGVAWPSELPYVGAVLMLTWCFGLAAWVQRQSGATLAAAALGFGIAGVTLGAASSQSALNPSLRAVLDERFGGFALDTFGPPGAHPPVSLRMRLVEDAAHYDFGVSLRGAAESASIDGGWRPVTGGVRVTVSGASAGSGVGQWRAGRLVIAPVTFRRPARYLNEGVPDFERDQALRGVALTGSVKSGLLVEVAAAGTPVEELAADLRAHVRAAVRRHVGERDPVAAAIVTAILIGDRTALPEEVRERLQAAGTYHVIAISGGNIAILAGVMAGTLLVVGLGGRSSALFIICGLGGYGLVVSGGPSVWRATLTAVVYLAARLLDHRSPPWNAMAVSAALLGCAAPLDVRDPGFALTFGATAAILEAARRVTGGSARVSWLVASVAASLAVEIVLLPINASAFSRATVAGLVLNLLAVPLMTVAQIAGLGVALLDGIGVGAEAAGAIAALAARALIESARLVEVLPWLAFRVPPPAAVAVGSYYASLAAFLWWRRARPAAVVVLIASGAVIVTGASARGAAAPEGQVRLTMFDVGQGDAVLLEAPGGTAVMVDAGGVGADGGAFDIGGRVLAPALWQRGVSRLGALAITHAHPDHAGGALAIVRDFRPSQVWYGVPMPGHQPSDLLAGATRAIGALVEQRLAGWVADRHGLHIRVLHPPAPDWERLTVRNDDSIVLEVRYGDVAMLLTGDISAEVERAIARKLTPARIRILKVAHHGSRTSTSTELLEAWRPHIALISCGRGNRFGHPAAEVVRRLEAAGARIYRTDRHGQVTVETDGSTVSIRSYVGGSP